MFFYLLNTAGCAGQTPEREWNVRSEQMEKLRKTITRQEIIHFLESHKQQLRDRYGVTRIGLFGSYSRNEAKESSDIDLAVEIQSSNKYRSFFGLKRHLEKSFNHKVDLGIESTLKPIAKQHVLKEIIYVET